MSGCARKYGATTANATNGSYNVIVLATKAAADNDSYVSGHVPARNLCVTC